MLKPMDFKINTYYKHTKAASVFTEIMSQFPLSDKTKAACTSPLDGGISLTYWASPEH